MKTLLDKTYSAEALCDVERDVYEALMDDDNDVPVDEHGFQKGSFKVLITWEPE